MATDGNEDESADDFNLTLTEVTESLADDDTDIRQAERDQTNDNDGKGDRIGQKRQRDTNR